MVFDAILDETLGTLCGLPPGTVTAATAVMGAVSKDESSTAKSTVKNHTSGLSEKEKRVLQVATLNLADTAKRDHSRKSDEECVRFAMKTLLVANEIYTPDHMKKVLLTSVKPSHSSCRKVMISVINDYKKYRG